MCNSWSRAIPAFVELRVFHPLRSTPRPSSAILQRNDDDLRPEREQADDKYVRVGTVDQRTCGPAIALFTIPAMTVRMTPPAPLPAI